MEEGTKDDSYNFKGNHIELPALQGETKDMIKSRFGVEYFDMPEKAEDFNIKMFDKNRNFSVENTKAKNSPLRGAVQKKIEKISVHRLASYKVSNTGSSYRKQSKSVINESG